MIRTTKSVGLAIATLFCFGVGSVKASITTTGPFEWKIADGGNGHFYELVMPDQPQIADDNFSWFEARDSAASAVLFGSTGHLATVTSLGEDEFLRTSFESVLQIRDYPRLIGDFAWIGLTDQVTEGQFQWVTGEAYAYSHWASTEPNNSGGIEHYVHYWRRYENGNNDGWSWNDADPGPQPADGRWGYIVEFDGPFSPVPEPASVAVWSLLSVAGMGYGARRRRRMTALPPTSD